MGGYDGAIEQPLDILIVEDEAADLELCRRAVARLPVNLTVAGSWAEARERLGESTPDCVWLDLHLPDGRGSDLVRWLLAATSGAVPVVVLTGFDDPKLGAEAVQTGAQDYVIKGHYTGESLFATTRYAILRARNAEIERHAEHERHFEIIRQLARGAADALNDPIACILTNQHLLVEELREAQFDGSGALSARLEVLTAACQESLEQARRVARVVNSFQHFVRPQSVPYPMAVSSVVRAVARQLDPLKARVRLELDLLDPLEAELLVESDCRTIIESLLQNALDASADTAVSVRARATAGGVEIEVEDDGPGIDRALAESLMMPFVSGDPLRAGMGLALAAEATRRLDGSLRLASRRSPTRFVLYLPAALRSASSGPEAALDLMLSDLSADVQHHK